MSSHALLRSNRVADETTSPPPPPRGGEIPLSALPPPQPRAIVATDQSNDDRRRGAEALEAEESERAASAGGTLNGSAVDTLGTGDDQSRRNQRKSWLVSSTSRTSRSRISASFAPAAANQHTTAEDEELLQGAIAGAHVPNNSMVSLGQLLRPQVFDYAPTASASAKGLGALPAWAICAGIVLAQAVLCLAISLYLSEAVGWRASRATLFALKTVFWGDPAVPLGQQLDDGDTAIVLVFSVLSYALSVALLCWFAYRGARLLLGYNLSLHHARLRRAFPGLPTPAAEQQRQGCVVRVLLSFVSSPRAIWVLGGLSLLCTALFPVALMHADDSFTYPEALMWCISAATSLPTTSHPSSNAGNVIACILFVLLLVFWVFALALLLARVVRRAVLELGPPPAFKIVSRLHGRLDGGTLISRYDWYALVLDAAGFMHPETKTMLDEVFQKCLTRSPTSATTAADVVPWSVLVDVCSNPHQNQGAQAKDTRAEATQV
ncbi:hypothetical protein PTSG_00555 [Salpingoeca rosetta]|uniref:Uncharacterized protein n=1 Tax=Salpingoeca rosetta (strain ATCC 50818 / BSB-021) TaxID=946362 RepID=F2TWT6_SALR5|nr:uncharacterized protein PTSG_00555 [Salpingoeca rosetta]EGD72532.1 hypothetical protein PTSG_00555 [Salpingoeca rosetta]|eukprot:XP_004999101.1 hypothetical protein PTSG_00555 [Salpingoeca rosetta]